MKIGNEIAQKLRDKRPEMSDLDLVINTWYHQTDSYKEQLVLLFKSLKKEGKISCPSTIVNFEKLEKQFNDFLHNKNED